MGLCGTLDHTRVRCWRRQWTAGAITTFMNVRFSEHRLNRSRSFLFTPQVSRHLFIFNLSDLIAGLGKYRNLYTRITKVQAALLKRATASESCQITPGRTQNKMIPFRGHGSHKVSIAAMIFFAIIALLIFGMLRFCSARNQRNMGSTCFASRLHLRA